MSIDFSDFYQIIISKHELDIFLLYEHRKTSKSGFIQVNCTILYFYPTRLGPSMRTTSSFISISKLPPFVKACVGFGWRRCPHTSDFLPTLYPYFLFPRFVERCNPLLQERQGPVLCRTTLIEVASPNDIIRACLFFPSSSQRHYSSLLIKSLSNLFCLHLDFDLQVWWFRIHKKYIWSMRM